MTTFVVIIVAADGLAPLGARPSADTMMTQFRPRIYIRDQHCKGQAVPNRDVQCCWEQIDNR